MKIQRISCLSIAVFIASCATPPAETPAAESAQAEEVDLQAQTEAGEPADEVEMSAEVAALVEQLKADDVIVTATATANLGRIGSQALPALPALLELHNDTESIGRSEGSTSVLTHVRSEALTAIANMGPRAVSKLLGVVEDLGQPEGLRAMAAAALGKIGDSQAVPALISSLNDGSTQVVEAGITALGDIGDDRALDPLLPFLTHKELSLGDATAKALGKLGDPRAVEPMLAALPVWRKRHWGGLAYELRHFARDPRLEPALIDEVHQDGDFISAATVLGEIKSQAAVEVLVPYLTSDSQPARATAVEALGQIQDARAIEPLIKALRVEKDEDTIGFYIRALQSITGQRLGSERAAWLRWWSEQHQQ